MSHTPEMSVVPSPSGLAQGMDVTGVILGQLTDIESGQIQNLASMASPISVSLTINILRFLSE